MSCFCCYSKNVDPGANQQYYSPNCHKRQLVSSASYCMQDENHHCCSTTNYDSPSHRHIPNIASPLHIAHPSPHSHHPHCTTQQVDLYHTPQQHHNHRRMFPHTHACHGQRELIPPHCTRPLPQSPPTNHSLNSSLTCPNTQLHFSPISSTDSPPPTISSRFRLAYTEEELTMIALNKEATNQENSPKKRLRHLVSVDISPVKQGSPRKSTLRSYKSTNSNQSIEINDEDSDVYEDASKSEPAIIIQDNEQDDNKPPVSTAIVQTPEVVESDPLAPTKDKKKPLPEGGVTGLTSKEEHKPVILVEWWFDLLPLDSVILLGYREEDRAMSEEPELWQTGPIVDRISSRDLRTEEGTTYHLKGCLNKQPLCEYGQSLSKATIRKFRYGFPEAWKSLLAQTTVPTLVSTAIVQTPEVVESDPLAPTKDKKKPLPEGGVTGLTSKEEHKPVVLVEWWFDLLPLDSVILLGYREEDRAMSEEPELWQTGPIVDRISSRDLRTEQGTTYHLKGCLNKQPLCKYGPSLSKATIRRKFRYGFPEAWKSLLAQTTVPTPVSTPVVEVIKEEKKIKKEELPFHTPSLQPIPKSEFLSSLKRSSRGRTLKPSMSSLSPYLQTSTDIYSYDVYGNFQGFVSPTIDLTISDVDDLTPTKRKPKVKKEVVKKEDEEFVIPIKVSAPNGKERSKSGAKVGVSAPDDVEFSAGVVEETAKGESAQESSEGSTSTLTKSNRKTSRPQKKRQESKKMPSAKTVSVENNGKAEGELTKDNQPLQDTENEAVNRYRRTPKKIKQRGHFLSSEESDLELPTKKQPKSSVTQLEPTVYSVRSPTRPTKIKTPGSAKGKRRSRVGMPKKVKPQVNSKSGCRQPKKAKPPVDSTGEMESEEEAEDGWTPSQVTLLKSIVHGVPAIESDFWEKVASRLPGYTARECSSKYMEACTGPSTKRQPKQKQAGQPDKTEKIAITGKVGTLKRKRQLRAALEHMDKGYVDDIFESTPFKKKVKTRVKIPDWSSESECDDKKVSSGDEEGEVLDTPNPARRRMGAPRVHTPKLCDFIATPDLKRRLNRKAADNVIYQIQKAKKPKPKRSKPLSVPASSKAPATAKVHFSEQKLRSIRTGETRMLQMFEDTDEEDSDDYPFSDIDNAYNKDTLSEVY